MGLGGIFSTFNFRFRRRLVTCTIITIFLACTFFLLGEIGPYSFQVDPLNERGSGEVCASLRKYLKRIIVTYVFPRRFCGKIKPVPWIIAEFERVNQACGRALDISEEFYFCYISLFCSPLSTEFFSPLGASVHNKTFFSMFKTRYLIEFLNFRKISMKLQCPGRVR